MRQQRLIRQIIEERERQDELHEFPILSGDRMIVLVEEVGEVAAELQVESNTEALHAELVQVAAVALRWLEELE